MCLDQRRWRNDAMLLIEAKRLALCRLQYFDKNNIPALLLRASAIDNDEPALAAKALNNPP